MFHYRCWAAAIAAGPGPNQERAVTCPNCRGRGHVIACWNYMDTSITTQFNPQTGQEAPNHLGESEPQTPRGPVRFRTAVIQSPIQQRTPDRCAAQHYQIGTPSSPSIAWGTPTPGELDEERFVVIPSTSTYANEWTMGCTGFSPGTAEDRQVEGSPTTPTIYHVETRLPNGKPALLLDIGSVGNLACDAWVRQQAAMALRAGLRPEQRRRERPLTVRGVGQGGEKSALTTVYFQSHC